MAERAREAGETDMNLEAECRPHRTTAEDRPGTVSAERDHPDRTNGVSSDRGHMGSRHLDRGRVAIPMGAKDQTDPPSARSRG